MLLRALQDPVFWNLQSYTQSETNWEHFFVCVVEGGIVKSCLACSLTQLIVQAVIMIWICQLTLIAKILYAKSSIVKIPYAKIPIDKIPYAESALCRNSNCPNALQPFERCLCNCLTYPINKKIIRFFEIFDLLAF